MRFHPQHGWIYDKSEVQEWGRKALAHIMEATNDRQAIKHLDFDPEDE